MSTGTLSRIVPARRKTVKLLWITRDFLEMSQKYRDVRKQMKSPMDACFWCRHKFEDGEMMGLVAISGKLNQVICHTCIDVAQTSGIIA